VRNSFFGLNRPRSAADWFALRLGGGANPLLERQFRDWLSQSPAHAEEYALCEITWEVSHDAAKELPDPAMRMMRSDRSLLTRSAAACAVAAALAALVVWFWPPATLQLATAPGEQRTVVLDDGSRVTLNTRTHLSVRFARGAREVVLHDGEAYFEVSKDASRPFTVRTALGSARAVGTHFNVYLDDAHLLVTTEEGRVLVDTSAQGSGVMVDAGQHADLRAGESHASVQAADLNAALAWLNRRLEEDNAPLSDVLRDFSRYTRLPIRAATPRIAALRVSAVLRSGDLEALQATLAGALGLDLERRGNELVVIDPKRREANPP